jgi:CSLREA domain-containing protein
MRRGAGLTVIAAALALTASASTASAGTITVTTTADEHGAGPSVARCGLREALTAANADGDFGGCDDSAGADVIAVPAGTYFLTRTDTDNTNVSGDLDVTQSVTIARSGAGQVVIDGINATSILHVLGGATATISGVIIQNGFSVPSSGGINVAGSLVLSDSAVVRNSTSNLGGGIQNGGTTTLTNVTVSGNTSDVDGGGIDTSAGALTLNNSTVSGNFGNADMGVGLVNGGGINRFGGVVTLRNSIVAGNFRFVGTTPEANDCAGTIGSDGHNLIGTTANCAGYTPAAGDLIGANAALGSLADNGGGTLTHALLPGSAAIDAGNPAAPGSGGSTCAGADQRGLPRAGTAGRCDIGAFEVQPASSATPVECGGRTATIVGTDGKDVIRGTGDADVIAALDGKDRVKGLGGGDVICGGGGGDELNGGAGKDRLLGEAGRDELVGGKGNDSCKGGPGKDTVTAC